MGRIHAERALALVGVPFRPQGRSVDQGVDCVGLTLAAFALPTDMVRADYRLRGYYRAEVIAALLKRFRRVPQTKAAPGDLLLFEITGDQLHLAVLTDLGFVHADAQLRRVVETPGVPPWPLIATYRRRVRKVKH